MSFGQCQLWLRTKSCHPGRCTQTTGRGGSPRRRRIIPTVAPLEERTLLTTPTITTLGISAASLSYGQKEVFTATVTTDPPSSTTPSGGSVTFLDGSTTLATAELTTGNATFSTASLGVGTHVVTAVYSGDAAFGGSSTANTAGSIISTVAGAGLSEPFGVAADLSGDLFIADGVIREVDLKTGVMTTVAGGGANASPTFTGPATAARLNTPYGVAVDSSGDLFIADSFNNVIREVKAGTGVITTVAGNGTAGYSGDGGQGTAAELDSPLGIAVDSSGHHLFIADTDNSVIRELNVQTGVITTVAGGGTNSSPTFSGPATDVGLLGPAAVAVDSTGNLFIFDFGNYVIREVNAASGMINTVAGNGNEGSTGDGGPATDAELKFSYGIAVDSTGDLFMTSGDVIREVKAGTGVITTVVGNGTAGDSGDGGPATAAELDDPYGVAVDSSGNLFISDSNYGVIREVSSSAATGAQTVTVLAPPPATVNSVSIQKIKTGKHKTSEAIVLQFSTALNSADAQNLSTYSLVTVPTTKKHKGKAVAQARASYNATTFTVTLMTRKPLVLSPPIQLTVKAASLLDALGRPLDGNDSGQSGANFVAILGKSGARVTMPFPWFGPATYHSSRRFSAPCRNSGSPHGKNSRRSREFLRERAS